MLHYCFLLIIFYNFLLIPSRSTMHLGLPVRRIYSQFPQQQICKCCRWAWDLLPSQPGSQEANLDPLSDFLFGLEVWQWVIPWEFRRNFSLWPVFSMSKMSTNTSTSTDSSILVHPQYIQLGCTTPAVILSWSSPYGHLSKPPRGSRTDCTLSAISL